MTSILKMPPYAVISKAALSIREKYDIPMHQSVTELFEIEFDVEFGDLSDIGTYHSLRFKSEEDKLLFLIKWS